MLVPTEGRPAPRKRGPAPIHPDKELLGLIRAYLEASSFVGEGHRKVFAHLKVVLGIRTSRTRILRIMRENNLLSPYRNRGGKQNPHDGTITTNAPALSPYDYIHIPEEYRLFG